VGVGVGVGVGVSAGVGVGLVVGPSPELEKLPANASTPTATATNTTSTAAIAAGLLIAAISSRPPGVRVRRLGGVEKDETPVQEAPYLETGEGFVRFTLGRRSQPNRNPAFT